MPDKNICKCLACGKEFKVKPYRTNLAKYCSNECMYKAKKEKRKGEWIEKTCPSCGNKFETLKSKPKKYCSEKCFHERNELYMNYNCDCCGKQIRIKKSYYKRKLDGKQKTITCSKECSNILKHTGREIKCDNCGKLFYQRKYLIDNQQNHFCSVDCEMQFKHNQVYEDRKCEICGNSFHVSKKSTQRFCSIECQKEWQKTRVGILNPKFNRQEKECEYCHKKIYVKNYKVESGQHNFCSSECRQKWYSEIWSQQEEWKQFSRETILRSFKNGKMGHVNSKPQMILNGLLNNMNIAYEREYTLDFYSIDNYLIDNNLIIEVQGDYWHSYPLKYKNILNEMQIKNIRKDKAKHTYIKKYYNIEILYLWENDIIKNTDVCEKLIRLYINSNGILNNYNSFNYYIDDKGNLNLKNNIVIPYQDRKYETYKNMIKQSA